MSCRGDKVGKFAIKSSTFLTHAKEKWSIKQIVFFLIVLECVFTVEKGRLTFFYILLTFCFSLAFSFFLRLLFAHSFWMSSSHIHHPDGKWDHHHKCRNSHQRSSHLLHTFHMMWSNCERSNRRNDKRPGIYLQKLSPMWTSVYFMSQSTVSNNKYVYIFCYIIAVVLCSSSLLILRFLYSFCINWTSSFSLLYFRWWGSNIYDHWKCKWKLRFEIMVTWVLVPMTELTPKCCLLRECVSLAFAFTVHTAYIWLKVFFSTFLPWFPLTLWYQTLYDYPESTCIGLA